MKKKVLIILFFGCFFLLAGCNLKNNQVTIDRSKQTRLIKKNQRIWSRRIKNTHPVSDAMFDKKIIRVPDGYNDEDMSYERLKNGNQLLIKGKVINLQPENYRSIGTETKGTVQIEKVISGDESFKGKTIETEFSGGITQAKDYFTSIEGKYFGKGYGFSNPKTKVLVTNSVVPMPNIGNTVILGLNKYRPENKYRQAMYKKNGLTLKNFYVINNPEVTYWVMRNGQFKLNNPAFYQKKNRNKYPQLFKITKKLNKTYL